MIISKKYIGKHNNTHGTIQYYMINTDERYGIELIEEKEAETVSTSEWVSEDKESTLELAKLLCTHGASPIHLGEIIDNYIS